MRAVIGYLRVSTGGQVEDGVSLAAQRAKIRQWAELNDYEVLGIYEDAGLSGSKMTRRPGLHEAIENACKNKAALVIYSLSRLARSTRDTLSISERLSRAGAELVSISEKIDTTSASGKMVFRLLAVLAEFERDQVSERNESCSQSHALRGKANLALRTLWLRFVIERPGVASKRTRSEGHQQDRKVRKKRPVRWLDRQASHRSGHPYETGTSRLVGKGRPHYSPPH